MAIAGQNKSSGAVPTVRLLPPSLVQLGPGQRSRISFPEQVLPDLTKVVRIRQFYAVLPKRAASSSPDRGAVASSDRLVQKISGGISWRLPICM